MAALQRLPTVAVIPGNFAAPDVEAKSETRQLARLNRVSRNAPALGFAAPNFRTRDSALQLATYDDGVTSNGL
jgi:hypothetical protein